MEKTAAAALALLVASGGCESTPPQGLGDPTVVRKAAGDGQVGPAGSLLPTPLTVAAESGLGGARRRGVAIEWRVASPGGALSARRTTTDSLGLSSVVATLPASDGDTMVVEAGAVGASSRVTFTALAGLAGAGGAADRISAVGGRERTGMAADTLAAPLRVSVADEAGAALPGALVRWRIASGRGGALGSGRTRTDSVGIAENRWRLRDRAHAVDTVLAWIRAADGDTAAVAFTASVTGPPARIRVDQGAIDSDHSDSVPETVRGDTVTAAPGFWSRTPFRATVVDALGAPVHGAALSWTVTSGGGAVGDEPRGEGAETVTVNTASDGGITVWRRAPSDPGDAAPGEWIGATLSAERFPLVPPVTLDALVRP